MKQDWYRPLARCPMGDQVTLPRSPVQCLSRSRNSPRGTSSPESSSYRDVLMFRVKTPGVRIGTVLPLPHAAAVDRVSVSFRRGPSASEGDWRTRPVLAFVSGV